MHRPHVYDQILDALRDIEGEAYLEIQERTLVKNGKPAFSVWTARINGRDRVRGVRIDGCHRDDLVAGDFAYSAVDDLAITGSDYENALHNLYALVQRVTRARFDTVIVRWDPAAERLVVIR